MYPDADIPVLQMSLPTQDPYKLLKLGERLRPLRDEGVLIIGSGFLTHGLPFLKEFRIEAEAPGWSRDFDAWAGDALARGDVDALADFVLGLPATFRQGGSQINDQTINAIGLYAGDVWRMSRNLTLNCAGCAADPATLRCPQGCESDEAEATAVGAA